MTTASGDPVEAVAEAEATGETAAIFADIRAVFGVGVVNLVWRHLATIPGALPWCWHTVRPVYRDGSVAAAASLLRRTAPLPDLPPTPPAALAAVGVDAAGRAAIAAILAAYNHTNAMALVALGALVARLDGAASPDAARPHRDTGPEAGAAGPGDPLPTLLALGAMAPATATLVTLLDAMGRAPDDRIMASMWRHLAHWPGYLALAEARLAPLAGDGRLRILIDAVAASGRRASLDLAGRLTTPATAVDAPPPGSRADVATALRRFVEGPIGRMVPIALLLDRALPRDTGPQ